MNLNGDWHLVHFIRKIKNFKGKMRGTIKKSKCVEIHLPYQSDHGSPCKLKTGNNEDIHTSTLKSKHVPLCLKSRSAWRHLIKKPPSIYQSEKMDKNSGSDTHPLRWIPFEMLCWQYLQTNSIWAFSVPPHQHRLDLWKKTDKYSHILKRKKQSYLVCWLLSLSHSHCGENVFK